MKNLRAEADRIERKLEIGLSDFYGIHLNDVVDVLSDPDISGQQVAGKKVVVREIAYMGLARPCVARGAILKKDGTVVGTRDFWIGSAWKAEGSDQ